MSGFNTRLIQSAHLRQEMKINPRLYQAMELLYMPLLDLQQHLKQELAENPFLDLQEADVQDEVELDEEGKDDPPDDDIDWEEEVRIAVEERASLSPDALTGMEANLRFAGPETLETKIFGRLSAWQNWIFQRPNAVGPKGALTLYGQPESAEFDYDRT